MLFVPIAAKRSLQKKTDWSTTKPAVECSCIAAKLELTIHGTQWKSSHCLLDPMLKQRTASSDSLATMSILSTERYGYHEGPCLRCTECDMRTDAHVRVHKKMCMKS